MMLRRGIVCGLALLVGLGVIDLSPVARAADGNRLTYLDENNPYTPHLAFPKLATPQWVGEPGVEAVVILAIDDMRDPARYETYLRPILNRLKQIDGRAPVSIMSCEGESGKGSRVEILLPTEKEHSQLPEGKQSEAAVTAKIGKTGRHELARHLSHMIRITRNLYPIGADADEDEGQKSCTQRGMQTGSP